MRSEPNFPPGCFLLQKSPKVFVPVKVYFDIYNLSFEIVIGVADSWSILFGSVH
jgi:hypothetical protein